MIFCDIIECKLLEKGGFEMRDLQKIDIGSVAVDYASRCDGYSEQIKSSCHDRYEIVYIDHGVGKYVLEGKSVSVNPRSLFISRPLEYHGLYLDGTSGYTRYIVSFSTEALAESCLALLERTLDGAGGVLFSCSRQGEDILSILEKMSLTETVSESERAAFASALLTELVILLSSIACDKIVNTDDTLVPRVTRYINSNIQGDLRLDAISGQFFVNKCYLCRAFKQQSGISIHTYINQKRVLMAKQLIESGEVASRAADAVGFGDYSAFYRAYIKHLGVPPTSHQPKRGVVL